MFLGDAPDQLAAKTANGVCRWRPDWCIGQLRLDGCRADIGLPDMGLEEAASRGAATLVIGVANRGGKIAPSWIETMLRAPDLRLDIPVRLPGQVADLPAVARKAPATGRRTLRRTLP